MDGAPLTEVPAARGARLYVAFDDTDTIDADRGTGKVGRWFEDELPPGCRLWGVVRQQLLVHPDVPYTSHNSAAVCVIDVDGGLDGSDSVDGDGQPAGPARFVPPRSELVDDVVARAIAHLRKHWMDGSDPGLCVAWEGCSALPALTAYGRRAAVEVVTQAAARAAADGAHLSGHGGTEDGIIGAAAGVGLTAEGWNGRLIEYRSRHGHLRDIPEPVSVADLAADGITVVSIDRDAPVPLPTALVRADAWLRPRLWAGRPVLPIQRDGNGGWVAPGPRTIGAAPPGEDAALPIAGD
jgi:tRNA(Ile2) C34 agmatinyltransferase TiaS